MNQDDGHVEENRLSDADSDQAWEALADFVEEFCNQWETAPPEPKFDSIAKKLKQLPPGEFQRLGLIELVKVEFEFRSKEEFEWRPLESYVAAWPELGPADNPPVELVYEEFQQRADSEAHDKEAYKTRFPNNFNRLMQLVDDETIAKSISVFRSTNLNGFEPGHSVDDFDLLSKLGRGAFAVVFLARQNSMQRLVALKISADTGLEGQTLAQLDHPHIVRVYDQRSLPDDNLKLMYMQYIAGGSLADVIKYCHSEERELSTQSYLDSLGLKLDEAGQSAAVESLNRDWITQATWSQLVSRIGAQIASALEYAHEHQVLHRDLKPANILVDRDGYPKLVDFNVSFSKEVAGATASTYFGGSLSYMSLEQLEAMSPNCLRQADELTGACDVYSLGVLLFELLTGERPFCESSEADPGKMIAMFVEERSKGLPEDARRKIAQHEHLLVESIGRTLEADVEKRIKPAALRKQLELAANSELNEFYSPSERGWRRWVSKSPFLSVIAISFMIAMFATWFIISYNLAESIGHEDEALYNWIRRFINIATFNGGMIALYFMFRKANHVLRGRGAEFTPAEISQAVHVNLSFGHWAAVLFISLWTIAGVAYPILLLWNNVELTRVACFDFLGSHILAGLTTGAYVFCGVTCCSLAVWHPRLMQTAVLNDLWPEQAIGLKKLRWRASLYQVLAIATPLVSIAVLVNWRQTQNAFALSVLSTGALIGLVFLSWTLRKIHDSLAIIDKS